MRIAVGHADTLLGDAAGALAAITAQAQAAHAAGAELLLTPELAAFGGYPPRDLLDRPWLVRRQWDALHAAAAAWPLPVAVGAVEPLPGPAPDLANALVLFAGGRAVAVHRKCKLPANDVFDEPRHFRPGSGGTIARLDDGRRIGLTVCEDLWETSESGRSYAVDPLADLAGRCDVVLNASASPYHLGKPAQRRQVVARAARRLGCPVVWANLLGAHDELLFDGGAIRSMPDGRLGESARWSAGIALPDAAPADPDADADLWRALTFGLAGYCRRTRQERVVLGLSGGIDSAVVACLAVDALGPERVIGLLMPGPYSSRGSVVDALDLARALGIRAHQCSITRAWEVLLGELDGVCGAQPPGDLMQQNLQSRLRGCLVMAAANQLGAMALTTGNKSELAVGYCTIYGDMNGGLAPIGDVFKGRVYALARHANRERERIPAASLAKPPSAELRPDQTDQDNLPPYDVLDRILAAVIEDGADPGALASEDPATVAHVMNLVETSEFKRRQAAPVLRVSRKAFGCGRRMPVARRWG